MPPSLETIKSAILTSIILSLLKSVDTVSKHQLNIVMSFDALHDRFISKHLMPTLTRLKEEGTSAPHLMNIFPTKTFPNHFSIVTGRYAEEHGVIDNNVFDRDLNRSLQYSEELFTFNKSIEPIWIMNEKAGDRRHSGVMMWPGSEYKYKGILPTFGEAYNKSDSFKNRVDTIIEWILHPVTPVNLVFAYFQEPDHAGHRFGTNSSQFNLSLILCDNTVKYFLEELDKNKIVNYNMIILSDHGMIDVAYENIINLNEIIGEDTYKHYGSSPILQIHPKQGRFNEVLNRLRTTSSNNNSHIRVFTTEEIPTRWHYKNTSRAPPITLLCDQGYAFSDMYKILKMMSTDLNISYGPGSVFGTHGYDPIDNLMNPIFIATGPAFKENYKTSTFNTVDLYSVFAHMLNLEIPPDSHSGDFANVQNMFVSRSIQPAGPFSIIKNISTTAISEETTGAQHVNSSLNIRYQIALKIR